MTVQPDEFEAKWKSYVNELERLRLATSGDAFDRIAEIEDELEGIIESIADEHR